MRGYDIYALAHTAPVAIITALAGRSVLPFTPLAAWAMFALCAITVAMTIDILLGWPVTDAVAERAWRRRIASEGHGG